MFFETRLTAERIRRHVADGHWQNRLLWEDVLAHAGRAPEYLAVIGPGERSPLTYRQLVDLADRAALALLQHGVRPGDVVSVQLPNWSEFPILLLAIERIGAVMNPITTILRERELLQMLALGRSRMLVVPATFRGFDHAVMAAGLAVRLPDLQTVVAVGGSGPGGVISWDDFLGDPSAPIEPPDRAWLDRLRPDPNAVTELAFTSGTTGEPKGVLHTHNTAMTCVRSTIRRHAFTQDDVNHVVTPVGHNAGYFYGVRLTLQSGASMVLQESWDPALALELMQQHRITFSFGVTTHLIDLLAADPERFDISTLRLYMSGGASLPPAIVQEAMTRLPARFLPVFGMTEHGHTTGTDPDTPTEKVCSTDGSAQPEMELKIVNAEGQRLPPGQEGRLLERGPFLFVGYIQGRAFTEQFFDAEGFFDTGDLGYLDEDGYLRITGRAKDLIIRGGENVPVKDIEDVIVTHPSVQEVALVAAPDPRLGERVVAYVRLTSGGSLSLEQLRAFLAERQVTRTYWPEAVVSIADFPRTPSGKIQKFQLRAGAAEALG